jgi:hypothetical protein
MSRNQLLSVVENISNTLHVIISGPSEMLLDLITYAPPPPIPALFLPVSNIGKQSWPESDIFPAPRGRGDLLHFPHFHSSGQILPSYLILAKLWCISGRLGKASLKVVAYFVLYMIF